MCQNPGPRKGYVPRPWLVVYRQSKITHHGRDIVDRGKMKIKGSMSAAQKFSPEIFPKPAKL